MFDLEQQIMKWRKKLCAFESLEDGYIEELESHLRDAFAQMHQGEWPSPQNAAHGARPQWEK